MSNFRIFIIEDDNWYAQILSYTLGLNPEFEIEVYTSGSEALKNLYKQPSAITLDYGLQDMSGAEVLEKIKESFPDLPVVIVSAQEEIGVALELLKKGAYDYLIKNEETRDRIWKVMANLRDLQELRISNAELKNEITTKFSLQSTIIGESSELLNVFKLVEKVKDSRINVSITGETGTGKEMVAKAVHYNSLRANFPFVAINLSAVPEGLIESELFGHEKGAFTGAVSRKIGKFEQADKGTLFLDEIADISLASQTKILRVLQESELTRLGGEKTIKFDIRLIVATHKNLFEEVKKGNFREDLYYRVMGVPIELPPLRRRGNDILILANYFLKQFCKENKKKLPVIEPNAVKKLLGHSYPGNVRELKAVTELAAIMAEGNVIKESDIIFNSSSGISLVGNIDLTLEQYTFNIIEHLMKKYNDRVIPVAKKLDISKSTLYRHLRNMNYSIDKRFDESTN